MTYRPRLIPVLLLKNRALVKTLKFKRPLYLGDPINAVHLFNDMTADELLFLDIEASSLNKCIDAKYVKDIAEEASMPFSVGGGITAISQVEDLISNGAEKVVLSTSLFTNPSLVKEISRQYGNQSVVACIDVRRSLFGKYCIFFNHGKIRADVDILDLCSRLENDGIGEIIIQSIDRDGSMAGYDRSLISMVAAKVHVPITVCGGASSFDDMLNLFSETRVQGLAAGSLFLFKNGRNSFLINYPDITKKMKFRGDKYGV